MSATFTAQHAGRCGNCGDLFAPGDEVFYVEGDTLIAFECCGTAEPEHATSDAAQKIEVMPRGKTARDRCGTCFQIPATNGVCGCC